MRILIINRNEEEMKKMSLKEKEEMSKYSLKMQMPKERAFPAYYKQRKYIQKNLNVKRG